MKDSDFETVRTIKVHIDDIPHRSRWWECLNMPNPDGGYLVWFNTENGNLYMLNDSDKYTLVEIEK